MRKIWVHKAGSFQEAEEFDRKYYAQMTPEERLNIVQELREIDSNFPRKGRKGPSKYANRRRLQRVIKIIQ